MTTGHSLETMTAADFRTAQGGRFRLTAGSPGSKSAEDASGVSLDVELVEVTEHRNSLPAAPRAPFSLLFHGPLQPILPQAIYRMEHEGLGAHDIFIVPVGPDEPSEPGARPTAMRYEAVFG